MIRRGQLLRQDFVGSDHGKAFAVLIKDTGAIGANRDDPLHALADEVILHLPEHVLEILLPAKVMGDFVAAVHNDAQ